MMEVDGSCMETWRNDENGDCLVSMGMEAEDIAQERAACM